ncbi:MAG: hypothetical protein AVDCRST_MAG56-1847 [uncultured Cytophagales bacterium]|uniref:Uncharacterized protein n=1 Tax=uncultured Cytophagales bacterium TaxID=158755 RepID=A0A6J4IDR7_9SPHI|nr:MAG: hypothetical protein AVDCRST_MAG56-1847 [uncultured Cytophagales bacterium]
MAAATGEDFYNKEGVPDSADRYCSAALALGEALRFAAGQIRSRYLLGMISSKRGNFGQGVALIKKALPLSRNMGNRPLEAEGWYYLGEAYERSPADLPEKIRCYAQARQCYRQLGNREKEAYLLKCIADMHSLQGQYDQASVIPGLHCSRVKSRRDVLLLALGC